MTAKIDTQGPERIWAGPGPAFGWEGIVGGIYDAAVPGCHEYVRADLSAAREAAAWIAGRDAGSVAKQDCPDCEGTGAVNTGLQTYTGTDIFADCDCLAPAAPPTDTTALDRLIAERVREAVEACIEAIRQEAQKGDISEGAAQWCIDAIAARGSKEGQP